MVGKGKEEGMPKDESQSRKGRWESSHIKSFPTVKKRQTFVPDGKQRVGMAGRGSGKKSW